MGGLSIPSQKSQPITLGLGVQPLEGPRAIFANFDFSGGSAVLNLSAQMGDFGMSIVQTLFIDNSNNSSAASFTIGGTGQKVTCPPQTQAYFPCMMVGGNINIVGNSAGNVLVPVFLMNTYVDPMLWNTSNPTVTGTVTVSGTVTTSPLTAVYTNRSGSIAVGGTSQQLAAANGARRRLFIQNPATIAGQTIAAAESLFINFTTAAGVNDGVSIELQPGQSFDTGQGPISTEVVNVNAATAAHRFIAKEM